MLEARRIGIDTYRAPVAYMRADCPVCRSEGFEALTRVLLQANGEAVVATLNVVTSDILAAGEVGLSDEAWRLLRVERGHRVAVAHAPTLESFGHVRAKMYGERLDAAAFDEVVGDVAAGRYPDVHLAAFVTACSASRLDTAEIVALTRSMISVGSRLTWPGDVIMDKHCVGGLPGNRTTPIVVAVAAAAGLTIPKTSSRAITSPAGTADVMETLTEVDLDLTTVRAVVEREGGCVVWGGAAHLSPVDDVLIRIERALDVDSEGQLVASVLSKKAAAGSTHVVIDIPVGPTAKVRSAAAGATLARDLVEVGRAVGLEVQALITEGREPVGRGIGPALEARDVVAVLRRDPDAPRDLRERALALAARVLEIGGAAAEGDGEAEAREFLDTGAAEAKFEAICEAQGGRREPPTAPQSRPVRASMAGRVARIDSRRLSRAAKLAGAPADPAAGLEIGVRLGQVVERGQPLFTLHAENTGELAYASAYVESHPDLISIAPESS